MSPLAALLDLLLPPTCAACGAVSAHGLCADCGAALGDLSLGGHRAVSLGARVDAVGAYVYASVVRDAIIGLKVAGRHAAATPLSRLLWFEVGLPDPVRAPWPVTWVPSTWSVRRRRGVEIPQRLAGPGAVRLLRRMRGGPDQTSLDAARRRSEPLGAFAATRRIAGRVVIVDDVRTTGATALAAAGALLDAGAERVLVVTFAVSGEGRGATSS